MNKDTLVSIITKYFEDVLDQIYKQTLNLNLKNKTKEEIKEIEKKVEKDRNGFIEEINRLKEANLMQLDFNLDELLSHTRDVSTELADYQLKQKLFQNNFCIHVSNKYLEDEYNRYLGVLFTIPFYLDLEEIATIK